MDSNDRVYKYEVAFMNMQQKRDIAVAESAGNKSSNKLWHAPGGLNKATKMVNGDERRREEMDEKITQLILWGPHLYYSTSLLKVRYVWTLSVGEKFVKLFGNE
ncbi:hypothetical protein CFOL_v3_17918 [Cephalotus follicularis]|uniref:Uncharacterized protein n=1 Tax=Cephalotus follicularis TaxID=3775 RepID=A0A1Q3C2X8_CEPFO|nr:hypothetical protein CFOL_v3_17918 [Cephalotus follicularis]